MNRPKVYCAVPIRGYMGKNATIEYMAMNCQRAKKNMDVLQVLFPKIEWISVAPFDRIVQKLLAKGQVSIESVLEADFELGDECDGLLAHFWEPSGGAEQELVRQKKNGKITLTIRKENVWEIWKCDHLMLENFVVDLLNTY